MPESLSLEDLMGHETDPADVRDGSAEPEYFKFIFHRDDIGDAPHEAYPATVGPVATAESRYVRATEDDGWRFFAEIRTRGSRKGSNVSCLMESDDGEIQDVLVDSAGGVDFLRPVTIYNIE